MPEPQTVTVCRLVADEWQAYRAIRLAMLQESPSAFGSTHAEAASIDEQLWRQRLADNDPAGRLYERTGFVPTGRTIPYPHDDRVVEVEMELVLEDGS